MVPIAANSLTSPAPVAPIRCPGSISMRPTAKPASDPATVTPLVCDAANETPRAAMPRVSVFGTRRLQTSTTALAPPLAATAATTATSEILGNALPEHRVDGVPNLGHRGARIKSELGRGNRIADHGARSQPSHWQDHTPPSASTVIPSGTPCPSGTAANRWRGPTLPEAESMS